MSVGGEWRVLAGRWWQVVPVAAICLAGGCGGAQDAVLDDVTSPIASYLDEEALDTIREDEAAAAVGAGDLSEADRDRIIALEDIARRWAASSGPLWTALVDADTDIDDFVPRFESNRADLAGISEDFNAGVESIDDPGLADAFRPFAKSIGDQIEVFAATSKAIASGDIAAAEAAGQRLDEVLAEGHQAQDRMLSGLRDYIDVEGFCASLPDGGDGLPDLCGSTPASPVTSTATASTS